MAMREVESPRSSIRLSDEFENGYTAIANRNNIKESGRMLLKTIGDQLEQRRQRESGERSINNNQNIAQQLHRIGDEYTTEVSWDPFIYASLNRFVGTMDTILEWVEHSASRVVQNFRKEETVLRGIFHLTDLGDQAHFFALLEFGSDFLAVKEEPYQAQRKFILKSQEDIKNQKLRILQLVEEAGDILKAIINDEQLDRRKGIQFDNIVREADVAIRACNRHLQAIQENTKQLSNKMATIKWFYRTLRFAGCVATGYYFYRQFDEGSIGLPRFVVSSSMAAIGWFGLYPSHVHQCHEDLCALKANHSVLKNELDNLRDDLSSAKDFKDGVMKNAV